MVNGHSQKWKLVLENIVVSLLSLFGKKQQIKLVPKLFFQTILYFEISSWLELY